MTKLKLSDIQLSKQVVGCFDLSRKSFSQSWVSSIVGIDCRVGLYIFYQLLKVLSLTLSSCVIT